MGSYAVPGRTPCLAALLLVALAACSPSTSVPPPAAPAATPTVTAGNACDRQPLTRTDVAVLLSEPIASVEPLRGDPQSCVFRTSGFSTVTVSVRPGAGDMTVEAWLAGKMNVEASAASGVGDKAAWTPTLKELNASRKNVLCDIAATGPGTAAASEEKLVALCNKIFAGV